LASARNEGGICPDQSAQKDAESIVLAGEPAGDVFGEAPKRVNCIEDIHIVEAHAATLAGYTGPLASYRKILTWRACDNEVDALHRLPVDLDDIT